MVPGPGDVDARGRAGKGERATVAESLGPRGEGDGDGGRVWQEAGKGGTETEGTVKKIIPL